MRNIHFVENFIEDRFFFKYKNDIATLVYLYHSHSSSPRFFFSPFSVAHCLAPAPLKLRPYGEIQNVCYYYYYYY